jgi:hypothetical protein
MLRVNGDELMGAIRRWEKEGSMKEYDMAVELLMRSNGMSIVLQKTSGVGVAHDRVDGARGMMSGHSRLFFLRHLPRVPRIPI